jgi:hypothetical protein
MRTLPYWLSGGSESCAGCTLTYVREVEIRCPRCDRSFCWACVVLVRETLEWLCEPCRGGEEAF